MLRTIALTLAVLFLSGCKLAAILVEGGEVQSSFGICQPTTPGTTGTVCIYEVTGSESFTAVPATGWEFVKWNSGGNFLCEDATDPICVVTDVGALLEPPVATDKTYYIMPVFEPVTVDEAGLGRALGINFTPQLLVDQLLVEVAVTWLTDPAISLDIEITGINGGFEHHGTDLIDVMDTTMFSSGGGVAKTIVDWTQDTTTQNVNEVYTICIQPLRNTTELIGTEKCAAFGPY